MTDPSDPSRINDVVDQLIDEHARKVAKQTLRTVTLDEQVYIRALDFYDTITRHPTTGEMHREHVSHLLWILGHCTDNALRQCAETLEPLSPMTTARQCFARCAEIILKRRGVGRTSVLVN